jgi:flagellar motility protein MotE (MotC chaperone)
VTGFKSRPRILRLLPGVMLACGALLALKASGIVHDAFALESTPAAGAMAPAPQSVNRDFAGGDGAMASAAEVDVLTSLGKRRAAMDAREAEIQTETNILAATESRVDAKIAQLKDLQTQIAALLTQRDAAQEKQVVALVKTYSAMKPKDAAGIFNSLDDSVLLPVAEEMKSDTLAPLLAAMNPDIARKLTVKLASKLTLPDTTAAMAPVALPAAPTPAGKATASQGPADPASPVATPGAAVSKPKG